MLNFLNLGIFIIFNCLLGIILYSISYKLIRKNILFEKNLVYECGFTPFSDTRGVFEVEFFLISILFILFDIEIILLIPWVLMVSHLTIVGILSILYFFILLVLLFIYELIYGILNW